jgi:hypothetical protein
MFPVASRVSLPALHAISTSLSPFLGRHEHRSRSCGNPPPKPPKRASLEMTRDAPTAAGIGTGPRGPRTEPVWREETHRTRPLHRQRSTYHSRSFCVPIHDPRPIGPTLPPHIPIRSHPGDAVPVSAAARGTDPSRPFKEITPSSSPDNCPAYPPPSFHSTPQPSWTLCVSIPIPRCPLRDH